MNFPHSVVRHVFPLVPLIFRCMAYLPHRFPNDCNDRRFTEFQRLRSASVEGKPCGSPTKNGCANLTPRCRCRAAKENEIAKREQNAPHLRWSYHFVIAMWSEKEAQFAPYENEYSLLSSYSPTDLLRAFAWQ